MISIHPEPSMTLPLFPPRLNLLMALGACAALASGPTQSRAEIVQLTPAADNTIFFNNASPGDLLSNGSGDGLFAGRTSSSGYTQRALLRFDLSSIPASAVVTRVTLSLNVDRVPPSASPTTVRLHRVNAEWGEGPSINFGGNGAPTEIGDANWEFRIYPEKLWDTNGGDYQPTASSTLSVPGQIGRVTWPSTAALISDVTAWLTNPDANFGWLVRGNETGTRTSRKYTSRNVADIDLRPTLVVEFLGPTSSCALADVASDATDSSPNPNNSIGPEDLDAFIASFINDNPILADVASDSLDRVYNPNGVIGAEDLDAFIASFIAGC